LSIILVRVLNCNSAVSVEGRKFILTEISSSWLLADSVEVVGDFLEDLGLSGWWIWIVDDWAVVDLGFRRRFGAVGEFWRSVPGVFGLSATERGIVGGFWRSTRRFGLSVVSGGVGD
jgi:hypothetical protein